MAYKRIIQCDIGTNSGTNLRISDLDLSFSIERNTDVQSNSAVFTIYNAKQETRNNVLRIGNNIILRTGYEDENNLGIIFSGLITDVSSKRSGVDYVTELEATDLGSDLNSILKTKISLTYKAGQSLSVIINDLAGLMQTPVIGIENASSIILNNGFVFAGSISKAIKKVRKIAFANGLGVYFDLGELVIYQIGIANSIFGIVRVTENSGLVGEVEDITDDKEENAKKRVGFSSLMNPKIRPNSVIVLATNKKNGAYVVERCVFKGGTKTDEFVVEVEAVE